MGEGWTGKADRVGTKADVGACGDELVVTGPAIAQQMARPCRQMFQYRRTPFIPVSSQRWRRYCASGDVSNAASRSATSA